MASLRTQTGFTLIELLITLLISSVLMLGISTAYSSVSGLIYTSKNLENAQEVLRFSADMFSLSLKQTHTVTDVTDSTLTVEQYANAYACDGSQPSADFTETFSFDETNHHLKCDIGDGANTILTGVESISFSRAGDTEANQLISITVQPLALNGETATEEIQIDIALSGIILANAMGE